MATTTESDTAFSGGILVILGIIVALGLAYFFFNYMGTNRSTDVNIRTEAPATTSRPTGTQ
jgi:hypothetical protein